MKMEWVFGSLEVNSEINLNFKFSEISGFFESWTQSGHMIAPFWSRNLSDTTHERSHTKCQHIWAVNIAFTTFTRGGAESSLVKGGSRTLQYYGLVST